MKKKEDKLNKPIYHKDHKLRTRRDFLGQGFISGVGFSLAPSLLGLMKANQVYGAENCFDMSAGNVNKKTPVIIIDLGGGANIAGSNVLVGDQGGQHSFLANYRRLGLPDSMSPSLPGMINSDFGIKFHAQSGMLRGLLETTTATLRNKVDGAIFCAASDNDTQNNPHNPMYWLNKAGAIGELVQTAGTEGNRSGGKSNIPSESFDPTVSPVLITRPEDCAELVSLGRVGDLFNQNQAQRILKTMENMSERKLASFTRRSLPEQVKAVVSCGFDTSSFTDGKFTANALDPRQDTDVTALWDNLENGDQRKQASIAKMVLDGYIGAGTIEMGGYDYHNQDRVDTDNKDANVGRAIGRIMALAERKQTDVFIYVLSDGSVSSNQNTTDGNGKYRFSNDDENRAATLMMVYKHNANSRSDILRVGTQNLDTARRQIGHYNSNIAVERTANLTSNNVTNLAKAVVANYLAFHNEENRIDQVLGSNPFGANLEDYLIFKG